MMGKPRLAVSNIAWAPREAEEACQLLQAYGFHGLEIAPGLAFAGEDDPFVPSAVAVDRFNAMLSRHQLSACSMQSLLFGVEGAQLFGSADERARLESAIDRAIALGERLGIANLVFGSPGNRAYPEAMTAAQAEEQAAHLFLRLAERAVAAGTRIAIEPNPAAYGTNFLTTVESAARFVTMLDHPGIALNFDIGALITNEETAATAAIYDLAKGAVSHVHISEPGLAAAPANGQSLAHIMASLTERGFSGWYSIEMRAPESGALQQLETSLIKTRDAFVLAAGVGGNA